MAVYLLHFDQPLPRAGTVGAQHYIGSCEPWQFTTRMRAHSNGTSGARIVAAFHKRKIPFKVARVWWDGGRALEKYLKQMGHYEIHCPVCMSQARLLMTGHEAALASAGDLQAARRYAKRTRMNGGEPPAGRPTVNTGSSQVELPLGSFTTSGEPDPPPSSTTGGNATTVTVPTGITDTPSVGTKPVLP